MKARYTIILTFTLLTLMVTAQQKTHLGPRIDFEETRFSFDTLTSQDTAVHYFRFTNTGDEPLVISTAFTSCGCTIPTWPTKPILPGESDVVKIGFHTKNLGRFSKGTMVKTNATENPNVMLRINGYVKEPSPTRPEF